jgi:diadenosine tetraphosphate (Ap4A) HIT family hydrolase
MFEMMFEIDARLQNDGPVIADLALCKVILVNNVLFPWIILVPKVANAKEIIDLSAADRLKLMDEISLMSLVMKRLFNPDKLNVAALGNVVSQLHVHIVARYESDFCWPAPVFGKDKNPYDASFLAETIVKIQEAIVVLS